MPSPGRKELPLDSFFYIKGSLMKDSWWNKWSTVALFIRNPIWGLVIGPFYSRYHFSLLLIIGSIVLLRQLIHMMNQQSCGFVVSLPHFGVGTVVCQLVFGKVSLVSILVNAFRKHLTFHPVIVSETSRECNQGWHLYWRIWNFCNPLVRSGFNFFVSYFQ